MEANFLHIDKVHTWQAYKNNIYLGCVIYDEAIDSFTNVTIKIPAQIYLEDVAGEFRETAKENYKKYIDEI